MLCFAHPQTYAVAQCSQCHKGICTACAHGLGTATICSSCYAIGLREEIGYAQRSLVAVWVFTGIITTIAAFAALSAIVDSRGASILIIPLVFAGSWCLFWGWSPVWNGFRRIFAGWRYSGGWLFMLIVTCLIAEILIIIALFVGAFTGIQKYNEAKRIVANGSQIMAQVQQMP